MALRADDRVPGANGDAGALLVDARRSAGLTQKELAARLGISLWAVDELESGRADPSVHVAAIAAATGKPQSWFPQPPAVPAAFPVRDVQTGERVRRLALHGQGGRDLVLGAISLLVLIRVFTEIVPVLPRAANFVDIPVFLVLAAAAGLSRRQSQRRTGPAYMSFGLPVAVFVCLCLASLAVNLSRVEPGPALVFLYGFLAPIGVYAAAYRLWPGGQAARLSRLLVLLTVLELLVVFLYDVPRFASSRNPDLISGTFGTNPYQLVFFLLVATGLLAGIFTLEKGRPAARAAPLLFVLILATMLLAQYRALLVTTAVTIVLIAALLRRNVRGIVAAMLIGVSLAFTLSYIASRFPVLRFGPTVSSLTSSPGFYVSKRLHAFTSVVDLYSDNPRFIITGTGPGTFSSRAWYTFAFSNAKSRSNVQGGYAKLLTGGRLYHTDVSDKYVLPRYEGRTAVQGSKAVTSPFTSYGSLLAEVGLPGFFLLVWMYVWATARTLRTTARALRRRVPADPLPALLVACAVAFTVLLQMALLDNWLEVTRVTFLCWGLLAVCTKELDTRPTAAG